MMKITFPEFSGIRCLMMPYIQGDPDSVPLEFKSYAGILETILLRKGDIGFLTIDESTVKAGKPHRGARAKYGRALHTEAGKLPNGVFCWGAPTPAWGGSRNVTLESDVRILLASNLADSCAVWDCEHHDTSEDGDIGDHAVDYPYSEAHFLEQGELREIGILTPHESVPANIDFTRQFLRIVSSGVHGREMYFTENPLITIQD